MNEPEWVARARELRLCGMTYRDIGFALGKSDTTVLRWLSPEYKASHDAAHKAWRKRNPGKNRSKAKRHARKFPARILLRRAISSAKERGHEPPHITETQLRELLQTHNGLCAISGEKTSKLHLDHCHTTGKVRGLIDGGLNRALGIFKDDPQLLRKAAEYLECHSR
jgi:hypothetical protein